MLQLYEPLSDITTAVQQSNCLRHERLHRNEKPYQCKYCNKRFNQKHNCLRHENQNNKHNSNCNSNNSKQRKCIRKRIRKYIKQTLNDGKITYKCSICDKRYALASSARVHYTAKHTTKYQCKYNGCNKCLINNFLKNFLLINSFFLFVNKQCFLIHIFITVCLFVINNVYFILCKFFFVNMLHSLLL